MSEHVIYTGHFVL